MRNSIYITIIFWIIAGLALADNFYVSARGNDTTGDGSMANPWRTIQHAVDSITGTPANPHNICVAKGLYEEAIWMYDNQWESLLGGYDDSEIPWERDIETNLTVIRNNDEGKYAIVASQEGTLIEGFRIESAGWGAIAVGGSDIKNNTIIAAEIGTSCAGNYASVIEGNTLLSVGISCIEGSRHIIKSNIIIANRPNAIHNTASPQIIGNYITNAGTGISSGVPLIRDNIIEYCRTAIGGGGQCVEGNILRNNTYGVYDYLAGGGRFRNNLIVDNLEAAISLGPGSSVTLQSCVIAGNGMGLEVGTAYVRDTIFWGNEIDTYWPDYDIRYSFINQAGEGNVWDENGPGFVGWGDFSTTNPIWVDANRGETGGSGTFDDPFSSITLALRSYDYHLTSSSLCRGAGQDGKDIGFYPSALNYPEAGNDWGIKAKVRPGLYRERCLTTSYGMDIAGQDLQNCIIAEDEVSGIALGIFFGRSDSRITSLTVQGIGSSSGIVGHIGLAEIEGCRVENFYDGIKFQPFPDWQAHGYFRIINNEFLNCGYAISFAFGRYDGALIKGNRIVGSQASAMSIGGAVPWGVPLWTEVRENILEDNIGGIRIAGPYVRCHNNIITGTSEGGSYQPESKSCIYLHHIDFCYYVAIYNNLIFNNQTWGIYQNWGRYVEIYNNTIYGNDRFGIDSEPGETPEITNCIIWGNTGGSLGQYLSATYSCIEGGTPGEGNISLNPEFANPVSGDFHLKSLGGRWDPTANGGAGGWVIDIVHSPCIDAGDPASDYSNEPQPNGGRINMGAYGNTLYASKWAETPTPTPSLTPTPTPTATPSPTSTPTPTVSPTPTPTPSPSPTLTPTPTPTVTPTVTPTPSPTITPVPTLTPSPTLTPTPTPTGTPEISELEVNDGQLLSIAGNYAFLFSDVSELLLTGTFTQDSRGKITFTGTIAEDSISSPIDTRGKLRLKKRTDEVIGKLKSVAIGFDKASHIRLRLLISNGDLNLTMKLRKKVYPPQEGEPKIIVSSSQPLVCLERGARIVIEDMTEQKPGKRYVGSGTLYLPCGLQVPVTVKEKIKTKKDGSLIRRYKISASDRSARLKLKTYMPSAEADTMELLNARGRISYLKKLDPATVIITY